MISYQNIQVFFLCVSESSSASSSDSESDVEDGVDPSMGVSKTPDLRVCPLRSLVNVYEDRSYSPIHPDQDSGPVDPVFVDEESSGEIESFLLRARRSSYSQYSKKSFIYKIWSVSKSCSLTFS